MIPLHPHGSAVNSQHRFNVTPDAQIERSVFDQSRPHKTTLNAGMLVPFYNKFVYPGETRNVDVTILARMATQIAPFMDNLYIDTHFFAVPVRILQANWEKLNGQQDNPGDSTDFLAPIMAETTSTTITEQTLGDYFGFPLRIANLSASASLNCISALPFRAYYKIYNDWFRDENLIDSLVNETDDGPDPWSQYSLQRRGKRKDYFTGALPWPQKGTAVTLPLGTSAPVNIPAGTGPTSGPGIWVNYGYEDTGSPGSLGQLNAMNNNAHGVPVAGQGTVQTSGGPGTDNGAMHLYNNSAIPGSTSGIYADLTAATAATINSIRLAFQLQRLLERDARSGTRYIEVIRAQFGVTSDDARMQRSEYVGGGTTPLTVTPIPQTSSSVSGSPQSNLSSLATAAGGGHHYHRSFTEHCIVIGIMSIRQDYTYQYGLDREWTNRARFDFYWPALAHIGEQPIYNYEIYAQGTSDDTGIFGYQEAYGYIRYAQGRVSGYLRSQATGSLDIWTLAQDFGSLPTLGQTFIEENPPVDRVIATSDLFGTAQFVADIWIKEKTAAPLPVYSVPGYVDHF